MSRIKFYRRVRNAIMGITGKSNERIITDCTMISPLVNDKGMPVVDKSGVKKRSLKESKGIQFRRTGARSK